MLGRRTALVAGALVLLVAGLALGACGGGETKPATQARTLTPPSATATTPTVPTTPIDPVPTATTPTVPQRTTPTATTPAPTTTTPAPPTTPTTPTATSACGSVAGGFISDIRGMSVGCAEARATARDWLRGVQASGKPQGPLPARGLSCRGRLRGERASVGCASPDGRVRVTFSASP